MKHHSHPDIIARLKRAEGHLRTVIAMIESGKPCLEIAPQFQAVSQAVVNAKVEFIRDHIDHCFDISTPQSLETFTSELKTITKYL